VAGRTASGRRCAGSGSLTEAPAVDAARVIEDLRELARRTSDPAGAQRLCWGEGWRAARAFLAEVLAEIGLEHETDEAGNAWAYLEGNGADEPAVALGSHLDSVPDGGWLDGALGVMAGVGVLRAWTESDRRPPRTLALVDFADEEGARFGRSLVGSSAVAGTLDPAELADLKDAEGRPATAVLAENGVDLAAAPRAGARLEQLGSYLELHIEQGPTLDDSGAGLAAVRGCIGIERHSYTFHGEVAHAGTTPMNRRHDAGLAAAKSALAIERVASATGGKGVATTGQLRFRPGIITAVAGVAELGVDLRHPDAAGLKRVLDDTRQVVAAAANERGCTFCEDVVWSIAPTHFDDALVAQASELAGGKVMTSGALHDGAEIARRIPVAMLFVPSIGGISHASGEDTAAADLQRGIEALAELASGAMRA